MDAEKVAEDIYRTLCVFHPLESVIEIRALGVPGRGKPHTVSGYYTDFVKAARDAAALDVSRSPTGMYFVMNSIRSELFARSPNQLTEYLEPTTSDAEITSRNWLLVDIDPDRPKGIPSSDDELGAARTVAEQVKTWLVGQCQFPDPVEAISGYGWHLLFPISLDNSEESTQIVKKNLRTLAHYFGGDKTSADLPKVTVDTAVYNAGRITKLYGTMVRKGHSIEGRPQRRSQLVHLPEVSLHRWNGVANGV